MSYLYLYYRVAYVHVKLKMYINSDDENTFPIAEANRQSEIELIG